MIQGYAQRNNDTDVEEYFEELLKTSRLNTPLTGCDNVAANSILQLFSLQAPVQDEKGRYRSHNHRGNGIGLASVSAIVRKYIGAMKISREDGTFTVSILLYRP